MAGATGRLPVCSREHITPDVNFVPYVGKYPNAKLILVTGGAGYIGSHTVVELLESGWEVVIVDNFCNSVDESVRRAEELAGKKICTLFEADIRKKRSLAQVFDVVASQREDPSLPPFAGVIHFAGLKSVSESVSTPLAYYDTNVSGTRHLLATMDTHGVYNLVFSSSATVYGAVEAVPEGGLQEDQPTGATNAYGRSKLFVEEMLRDLCRSEAGKWNVVALRYFNPVGAHISGKIGEDPRGIPNNLMPFVTQVAVGKREALRVFGSDYKTKDGTGVRDFIHVVDLAKGHLAAIDYINRQVEAEKTWSAAHPGDDAASGEEEAPTPEEAAAAGRSFFASGELAVFNLGTGTGYSVLELVACMEKVSGKPIPYVLTDRRPGDLGEVYSNPHRAVEELRWTAKLDLERMCADAWRWQSAHPDGYEVKIIAKPPTPHSHKTRLGQAMSSGSRGFYLSGGLEVNISPTQDFRRRSSRASGFLETPAAAGNSENDDAIAEHLAAAKAAAQKRRDARK